MNRRKMIASVLAFVSCVGFPIDPTFAGNNPTVVSVSNATGKPGTTVILTVKLAKPNRTGIAGQPIDLRVDATRLGLRWTDQNGVATWRYTIPRNTKPGRYQIFAQYAGNGIYAADTGIGVLTVR